MFTRSGEEFHPLGASNWDAVTSRSGVEMCDADILSHSEVGHATDRDGLASLAGREAAVLARAVEALCRERLPALLGLDEIEGRRVVEVRTHQDALPILGALRAIDAGEERLIRGVKTLCECPEDGTTTITFMIVAFLGPDWGLAWTCTDQIIDGVRALVDETILIVPLDGSPLRRIREPWLSLLTYEPDPTAYGARLPARTRRS